MRVALTSSKHHTASLQWLAPAATPPVRLQGATFSPVEDMSLKLQSFRKRVAFASLPTGFSWPGPAQASKMPLLQSASLEPWKTPTIAGDKAIRRANRRSLKGERSPKAGLAKEGVVWTFAQTTETRNKSMKIA